MARSEDCIDRSGGYADYVAEMYDHVAPYQERKDVAFFVEMARSAGGAVLELGCGTGRVLIPLAREGFNVTGLDLAPAMLAACRQKLAAETAEVQSHVRLVEGDMTRFDLGETFRLVTIPFRPFQHLLTVEDQIACLQRIHQHLEPGGRLVLDLFNPSLPHLIDEKYLESYGEEPEFRLPDGSRVRRTARDISRDLFNQIKECELIYDVTRPDGRCERKVQRFKIRYLFRFEVEHLLVRCGFRVEAVYADYERQPYGSTYPGELIVVAQRD